MNEQVNSVYQVDSCRTRHDHDPRQKERTTVLCVQIENLDWIEISAGSHFFTCECLPWPARKKGRKSKPIPRQTMSRRKYSGFSALFMFVWIGEKTGKMEIKSKSFERLLSQGLLYVIGNRYTFKVLHWICCGRSAWRKFSVSGRFRVSFGHSKDCDHRDRYREIDLTSHWIISDSMEIFWRPNVIWNSTVPQHLWY